MAIEWKPVALGYVCRLLARSTFLFMGKAIEWKPGLVACCSKNAVWALHLPLYGEGDRMETYSTSLG